MYLVVMQEAFSASGTELRAGGKPLCQVVFIERKGGLSHRHALRIDRDVSFLGKR